MKESTPNLTKKIFFLHYFSVDCENSLKTGELNADSSTKKLSDQINMLSDTYAVKS